MNKIITNNLKEILKKKGITREELQKRLHHIHSISNTRLTRLMTNKKEIRLGELVFICQVLEIEFENYTDMVNISIEDINKLRK